MTGFKFFPFIFITVIISSCTNCPCIDADLNPNFISLSTNEADTVIIRKYIKNSNFTSLIDTAFFDDKRSFNIQKSNDTISFPAKLGGFSISKDYDWIFFLPGLNRAFKISDIVSNQVSLPCPGKTQCVNPVISLMIDGIIHTPDYHNFYIKK